LNNGFRASLYMTEAEIEKHAMRFSKMYVADKQFKTRKSKWSDPDARPKMAIKTVLKGLLGTYGVLSTEMVKAFANDDDNESEPIKNNSRTGDIEEAVVVQNEPELEPEKVEI